MTQKGSIQKGRQLTLVFNSQKLNDFKCLDLGTTLFSVVWDNQEFSLSIPSPKPLEGIYVGLLSQEASTRMSDENEDYASKFLTKHCD